MKSLRNGQYLFDDKIGNGGFGVTYRARDDEGKLVVIKFPNEHLQEQTEFEKYKQYFLKEAERLSQFNHPHIVDFIDSFEEEGLPYIVMEYIKGENLNRWVQTRGKLTEEDALLHIREIGNALIEIHQAGLLHRDVKPNNIMLRDNGSELEAVLIDFGIALEYMPDEIRTQTLMVWTPGYAPLEQYEHKTVWGEFTDVYALAATLYFSLTGNNPQNAPYRTTEDLLTPPQYLNPRISERVNQAILIGMELETSKRPQSIQEFLLLLDKTVVAHVSNFHIAIKEVLTWTGGQEYLNKQIFQIASNSATPKPGYEAYWIQQLVRRHFINNWQDEAQEASEILRHIRDRLLRKRQGTMPLLKLYQQILQGDVVVANGSREQQELLDLGLVIKRRERKSLEEQEPQEKLRVSNRIYKEVFNQNWVNQELANLVPTTISDETHDTQNTPGPLYKLAAAITLMLFLISIPVYLVLNSQNHSSNKPHRITPNFPKSQNTLGRVCNYQHSKTYEERISIVRNLAKKNQECQAELYKLLLFAAKDDAQNPQAGGIKKSVEKLCEIPKTASVFPDAKDLLAKWYSDNVAYRLTIKEQLEKILSCPVAQHLINKR